MMRCLTGKHVVSVSGETIAFVDKKANKLIIGKTSVEFDSYERVMAAFSVLVRSLITVCADKVRVIVEITNSSVLETRHEKTRTKTVEVESVDQKQQKN